MILKDKLPTLPDHGGLGGLGGINLKKIPRYARKI